MKLPANISHRSEVSELKLGDILVFEKGPFYRVEKIHKESYSKLEPSWFLYCKRVIRDEEGKPFFDPKIRTFIFNDHFEYQTREANQFQFIGILNEK